MSTYSSPKASAMFTEADLVIFISLVACTVWITVDYGLITVEAPDAYCLIQPTHVLKQICFRHVA